MLWTPFVVTTAFPGVSYPGVGFQPQYAGQMPYGVSPAALALLQMPGGLPPQVAAFLAMQGAPMPAHVAAAAGQNPYAARSAMDPRIAMLMGQTPMAAPKQQDWTAAQIGQNIRQTFGAGALPLTTRAEQAFALSEIGLYAALGGAPVKDLVQLLGGNKKEARKLAKSIHLLARRMKQQPQNPEKIARAVAGAHYNMIPFVANNKTEQKLGENLFRNYYGVGHPKDVKFNGQGPLGNAVANQAPGAVGSPGNFRTGNPSQAGQNALKAAISQIGVREATGNNDGVPSQRYMDGRKEPWCANFVSWAFRQAGHPLPGNQRAIASCDVMASEFKKKGKLMPRGAGQPKPGDVIFFGKPGDYTHVGIVEKVANGKVYTVEGNTSNMVARRSYSLNDPYVQSYGIT